MGLRFDDLNELLHTIRMQALGASYGQDGGDEDDVTPHRARLRERRSGETVAVKPWPVLR